MRIIRFFNLAIFTLLLIHPLLGQEKKVSLESVFKQGIFFQENIQGINWMNDGQYYSSLDQSQGYPRVIKINISTGKEEEVLIDGKKLGLEFSEYELNKEETKALVASEVEPIYRRSTQANYHLIDLESGDCQKLMDGEKISYATLSPDNDKVAFVKDNDLYYISLKDQQLHRVTHDGQRNQIINGAADWVYEEEFSMAKAFEWSPDGEQIAFLRFDETKVPEYHMQIWGNLYPYDYSFKYPKAGENNALVSIHVRHLEDNKTVTLDSGNENDIYLPRIYWTGTPNHLAFIRLNRLQNQLDIFQAQTTTGESSILLTETSDTYVDLDYNDNLLFLENNKGFIRTSEKDGYKHIYHHNKNGKLISQVTSGNWEVSELVGVDEKDENVYYISTEKSPLERKLFVIKMNGKSKRLLTEAKGTHHINMSPDFKYFIDKHTTTDQPLRISLHNQKGKEIKLLKSNTALKERISQYAFASKTFFEFETVDGTMLNGYMMRPADFDPYHEYPVLMYVYGGPGSQDVTNEWGGTRDFWHQHLVSEGYIVACIDNRGTGGRGKAFKHSTYGQLGKLETQDQIAGARYLADLPYVDNNRIGIWGWSYGGYLSSLSLMLGNDIFKTAIAVAPVTNWRYYDTIYTERYLKPPQLNPSGYDDNSPINHVKKLKGDFLLIHGTGDDNVHFQNSVDLVNSLIAADKQFETFYYPNRNHGIYGGNTTWHLYSMMTDFIKRKL
ncbi:S9 family peptidase [Echinicola jeungdonensis]|uniref:S9 family peptidase n=1 Tax=Echinicola jeungdonensis TaxID=709343 RepID=A0ABV5J543_9BACT|nr:S9 family peptidase [Echinicola jeungdonensis]MDN3668622.1 S9 family peptidase [Echinicola jeungdonensis]